MVRDVVIVLGAPNEPDGTLSPIARARADRAIAELGRRDDAVILPTGGFGEHFNRADEVHHVYVRWYLEAAGIDPARILPGVNSSSTDEDAAMTAAVLGEGDTAVVVTSEFHVPRAKAIFSRAMDGRTLEFVAAPNGVDPDALRPLLDHEIEALGRMVCEHERWILQMSGHPGSGKSTVARAIARHTGAVVVDHDVTKTALLEAGVEEPEAGRLSYMVLFGVADELVELGHDTIVDSTCVYQMNLIRGLAIAARHGVSYRFVECACAEEEIERRRAGRSRRASQVRAGQAVPEITPHGFRRERIVPPVPGLQVDTTGPVERGVAEVVAYLRSPAGS